MATGYAKLKSGDWGVRGLTAECREGATVTVVKRDGTHKTEKISKVVWTDGEISLCEISRRRSCPTGGNCSSMGSGRSCGADDCDGW